MSEKMGALFLILVVVIFAGILVGAVYLFAPDLVEGVFGKLTDGLKGIDF